MLKRRKIYRLMNNGTFECDLTDSILKKMFEILSYNMSCLYKTNITDKDYNTWSENVIKNKKLKNIINYDGELNGYLQYMDFNKERKICICEVEISKNHQGDGKTFKKLMIEFLKEHSGKKYDNYIVYENISEINHHSRDVVIHLGFETSDNKIYLIELSKLRAKYL